MANSDNSFINMVNDEAKDAFLLWFDIMDGLSSGALSNGYRPPTIQERIVEWDSLMPEQLNMLKDKKGESWVVKQAAEIDKFRKEIAMLSAGKA